MAKPSASEKRYRTSDFCAVLSMDESEYFFKHSREAPNSIDMGLKDSATIVRSFRKYQLRDLWHGVRLSERAHTYSSPSQPSTGETYASLP